MLSRQFKCSAKWKQTSVNSLNVGTEYKRRSQSFSLISSATSGLDEKTFLLVMKKDFCDSRCFFNFNVLFPINIIITDFKSNILSKQRRFFSIVREALQELDDLGYLFFRYSKRQLFLLELDKIC